MTLRPNEKRNMILSGSFISILLLFSMILIFSLSKDTSIFDTRSNILSYVKNAQNLKVGTKVKLKGINIGKIEAITIQGINKIQINIGLSDQYLKWIKSDSFILIETLGVLGDKFLEISGGTSEAPSLKNNDSIIIKESSKFDEIIGKGEDIALTMNRVMSKLDLLLAKIPVDSFGKTFIQLDKMLISTTKLSYSITNNMKQLSSSLNNIDHISNRIKEGPGTLHSLIYDKDLYGDMKNLLGGANRNKVLKYFIRETIKEK